MRDLPNAATLRKPYSPARACAAVDLLLAGHTDDPTARALLIAMARSWHRLADQADRTGNRVIAGGIRRAAQQIADGRGLSESFQSVALFPPLVLRMLRVGETTGALDEALDNVTYFYNREVLDSIENGLRVLEPLLTAILGLLLGGILVSVLLPIYDLIGNLPL